MPTNVAIKSIPLHYDIPIATQPEYDALGEGVKWTGTQVRYKDTFTPYAGFQGQFYQEKNSSGQPVLPMGRVQESIYGLGDDKGWTVQTNAGKSYSNNVEFYGDGRWLPASNYWGHALRTHTDSSSNNAVYFANYAIIFANRWSGTYRSFGFEAGELGAVASSGLYKRSPLDSNHLKDINEIRSWGTDWLLSGLVINYKTGKGTGSVVSNLWVHSFKVGWKFSEYPNSNLRAIPNGPRSYGNRNRQLAGFTDPYKH